MRKIRNRTVHLRVRINKRFSSFQEPGYYEDSNFGIRLENIAQIVPVDTKYQFKEKQFLTFETITLVPVQKKLLNPSMLTEAEVDLCREFALVAWEFVLIQYWFETTFDFVNTVDSFSD